MADDVPAFIPPPPPPERPLRARRDPLAPPPPPDPPEAPVERRGLFDWLGPRALRRPEPRLSVSLAAAGSGMIVVGAIAIGGDQLFGSGGNGSQFPGLLITLSVIVLGVTLTTYRHGPLAAAGVAASASALPPFLGFLTYSESSPPSFGTILGLSCLGWIVAYLLGPGRGHSFYLSAGLIGFWLWFLEVTEHLFSFPTSFLFDIARAASAGTFDSSVTGAAAFRSAPNATNVGSYSLVFAVAYLFIARTCDRAERRGFGTPFAFAGVVTLVIAIAALGDDLKQIGTGVAFTISGLVLAYLGATNGRRATNGVGAILVFGGLTSIVADPFDTATSFGLAEIVVATGVIAGAHWITTQFGEPPETEPVLSRFYSAGSVQPSGPPPPPAGSVLG